MRGLCIVLSLILFTSCDNSKPDEPWWMDLKVDLQNHLYNVEINYHLTNNTTQLLDSIIKDRGSETIELANNLHNETLKALKYLDDLAENMILTNGGRNKDFIPVNREANINLEKQFYTNGKGKELIDILIEYESLLHSYGLKYPRIVYEPKDIPTLKNDPLYYDKNFIELHFGDRNIFEALASIEYLKTSILLKESTALGLLSLENKSKKP